MNTKIEGLEISDDYCMEEVHFSGGLRGLQVRQGWALFPLPGERKLKALVFATPAEHAQFAKECGVRFIGACMKYRSARSHVPMDVWEPGSRDSKNGLHAADSWSAVAHSAREAGDVDYADCASYLSVCLKIAGLRLRDVSNGYHAQLRWALLERKKIGIWFSNAAILDLYADFHSLVSELCSARDYLAKLAGIHVGADKKVDSLARLSEWASRSVNATKARHPLPSILLFELGTETRPGWLRRLGDIRNEMLHRVPMARNRSASGLLLQEAQTTHGAIRTIRLAQAISEVPLDAQGTDPLIELSEMSRNFEDFEGSLEARQISSQASRSRV